MKKNTDVCKSIALAAVVSSVVAGSALPVTLAASPASPQAAKKPATSSKPQPVLTGKAKEEWELGEAAFKSGNFETAVNNFKEVVQLAPEHSRAHERLGSVMAATEKYEEGAAEERKAAALDPKDYLPHLILGRILLVLKGEKEGVDEAQKAYDINPFACAAFLNFANKDRFDPHRWFVQANYWKEMAAAQRAAEANKAAEEKSNPEKPASEKSAAEKQATEPSALPSAGPSETTTGSKPSSSDVPAK